jgi:hypothetical protein
VLGKVTNVLVAFRYKSGPLFREDATSAGWETIPYIQKAFDFSLNSREAQK